MEQPDKAVRNNTSPAKIAEVTYSTEYVVTQGPLIGQALRPDTKAPQVIDVESVGAEPGPAGAICGGCNGRGKVHIVGSPGRPWDRRYWVAGAVHAEIACPHCAGAGKIQGRG